MLNEHFVLFVIYAHGTGGNHLSNLLSLDHRCQKGFDETAYQESTYNLETYNFKLHKPFFNAHFRHIENLRIDSIKENIEFIRAKSTVLCGHLVEYLWFKKHNISNDKAFKNKKFCVIELPESVDSIAYKRMVTMYPEYLDSFEFHEAKTLYSVENLSKLYQEDDWFVVPSEILFSNTDTLLDYLANQGLLINYNKEQAIAIHETWFNKIKEDITN